MRSLEGQTALIGGGGTAIGRAIALALSARGVRIVVTGRDERALGETVGEVVHGGGKARHVAGDPSDAAHLVAVAARAVEVFGGLDIVIGTDAADAARLFEADLPASPRGPRRFLAAVVDGSDAPSSLVRNVVQSASARGIACNAIVVTDGAETDDAADAVAALAVFLCTPAGARITGQTIAVGREVTSVGRRSDKTS